MEDLSTYLPLICVVSVFLFTGLILLSVLFVLGVLARRETGFNPVILLLYGLFAVCHATGSIIIWTNNALNPDPPYGLCLFSAAVSLANVPLMATVVFSLVIQVAGNVLFLYYPVLSRLFGWLNNVRLLLILPFVVGLPIFFAALGVGIAQPDQVERGSPFYCTLRSSPLNIVSPAIGGLLELICLIFALWTAMELFLIHYRIRSRPASDLYQRINYPFVLRVLLFSLMVLMCFIIALVVIINSSFSEIIPDVFFSIVGLAAAVIFGSTRAMLDRVFRCRRHSTVGETPSQAASRRMLDLPAFCPHLTEAESAFDSQRKDENLTPGTSELNMLPTQPPPALQSV